jgi:hypothetical protein
MQLILAQLGLSEIQNMEAVLFGIERTTRLLLRCKYYEKCFLERKPFNLKSLEEIMTQLYAAVLRFLASAKNFFDQSRIRMSFLVCQDFQLATSRGLHEVHGKLEIYVVLSLICYERPLWLRFTRLERNRASAWLY